MPQLKSAMPSEKESFSICEMHSGNSTHPKDRDFSVS